MPSLAATSKAKRILSEVIKDGVNDGRPLKKSRVRFDDNVEILPSDHEDDDQSEDEISIYRNDDDDEVDFILSIGEDGEIDFTFLTSRDTEDETQEAAIAVAAFPSKCTEPMSCKKKTRPASPLAGCDRRLSDELYLSPSLSEDDTDDEFYINPAFSSSNQKRWNLSIDACDDSFEMPMPLITPPSSPRRICTMMDNGESEETTICEWPSNLAVDIAITAALESLPLSRRLSMADLDDWQ